MEKQMVEIGNIQILEPGTFISDIILAIASIYFFYILKKIAVTKFHRHWSYFFLFLGLSSFVGAFAHGLYLYTGKYLHFITWIITGIAIYFIQYGASTNIINEKKRKIFIHCIKVQFAIYAILTILFLNFITVKVNTAIGLLGIVTPIMSYQVIKFGKLNNLFVISGIVLAIIPALLHKVKLSIAEIFNMNDLSHFFLIFCLFLIFIGSYRNISSEKKQIVND